MADTTTRDVLGDLISEMSRERSKLLDLLMEARLLLVRAKCDIEALEEYAPHLNVAEDRQKIEAFLAAGLFGDRK